MIIKNASVFTEDSTFEQKDIYINGQFISNSSDNSNVLDAANFYAIPGLIDLHFHGVIGYDFSDGTTEAIENIGKYEAKNGVTSICPASLTLPIDTLVDICRKANSFEPDSKSSDIVGIHLEGPFFSKNKIGAQNPNFTHKPDIEAFNKLVDASGGLTKIVSISPEAEGAIEFISKISASIRCSVAHTNANYDLSMEAFKAGAKHVTHLFNAMPPFLSREPGVIGAASDSPECTVEIIADGFHLHPSIVRAAIKMFGEDRIIFISDSMMATGLSDGNYSLGGLPVVVEGQKAKLTDGTIAGSTTNLMGCLKNAVNNMNIPLSTAIKCSSVNPAKALNIYDKYGSISCGKYANIVLLDKNLEIKYVILRGEII